MFCRGHSSKHYYVFLRTLLLCFSYKFFFFSSLWEKPLGGSVGEEVWVIFLYLWPSPRNWSCDWGKAVLLKRGSPAPAGGGGLSGGSLLISIHGLVAMCHCLSCCALEKARTQVLCESLELKFMGLRCFYVTWDFSLGVPCCPSCSVHHHHAVLTPVCFCVNLSFHLLLPLSVTAAWQDDQTLPVRCVVLQHGSALQSLLWLQGERVPTCLTDPAPVGS